MYAVIAILLLSVGGLITLVFVKPAIRVPGTEKTVSIYWGAPLFGVLLLLLLRLVSPNEVLSGLTASGEVNPLKILTLFLSMTFLSVFLDEAKFFGYLASVILKKAGKNQFVFFIYLFLTVSVLTIFTSNDIIVLTFTPFICYFARKAKISPIPYLVCEFIVANTFSMTLMIGNPTNIYLSASAGVDFGTYLATMWLPTLLAGVGVFGMLMLLFYRKLKKPMEPDVSEVVLPDKTLLTIGLVHLLLCILCLAISSYLPIPMWILTLGFAASLLLCTLIYCAIRGTRPRILARALHRLPLDIIPFVLSMFVLVLALDKYDVTGVVRDALGGGNTAISYGIVSFLSSNLLNNIPMSVLFSPIVAGLEEGVRTTALYATVIGSNLGAVFTPLGALAGIMWTEMLRNFNVKYGFLDFVRYGAAVSIPALALAILGLMI